jgi:hypothetical protein
MNLMETLSVLKPVPIWRRKYSGGLEGLLANEDLDLYQPFTDMMISCWAFLLSGKVKVRKLMADHF